MNDSAELSALTDDVLEVFGWFCERAVQFGNPTALIKIEDVRAAHPEGDAIESGVLALMDHGYLQRAGWHQYAITQTGFQLYARSHITNYDERENAVEDAVAATDQTNTEAIIARTGEQQYLVNHILRQLQTDRDIGAFVAESNVIYVTRVSAAFKQRQSARRLLADS